MLEILSSSDGLRIVFSLLFISTILFVYEVTLFFKVIVPTVSSQINSSLEKIGKNNKTEIKKLVQGQNGSKFDLQTNQYNSIINNMGEFERNQLGTNVFNSELQNQNVNKFEFNSIPKSIHKILDLFRIREDRLNEKINNYTVYTGIILFLVFASLLYYIKSILNSRSQDIGICVWSNIGVSLVIIFAFQYSFYKYGQVYKYMGSEGNEELLGNLLINV
jgi:hypothetical protein